MFPERLKKLRKENNMTQTELAKALGVSGGTVAMWETDKRKPSFEMLEKLSEIFDKQLSYIMGTSDVPLAADLTNEDICQLGEWALQEQYEDSFRKYITLDEYGQNAVDAIIRSEFARCQEQGGLKSTKGISVAVKIRDVK